MWLRFKYFLYFIKIFALLQAVESELVDPNEDVEQPVQYGCVNYDMANKILNKTEFIENMLFKLITITPGSTSTGELTISPKDHDKITQNIKGTVGTKSELQDFIKNTIQIALQDQQKLILDSLEKKPKAENLKFSEKYLSSATGICNAKNGLPENCEEALRGNPQCSEGVYLLYVPGYDLDPFFAYCLPDKVTPSLPIWTIIQRRESDIYNFKRNWNDYRDGFGDVKSSYWLGLKYIHALTSRQNYELWVEMEDWEGVKRYATFDQFVVGSEKNKFPLSLLGKYGGNAGDSLSYHIGQKFTTIDSDNDANKNGNCAQDFSAGWWFNDCHVSNPNGIYNSTEYAKGINWKSWRGYNYSYKYIHLAIRPRKILA